MSVILKYMALALAQFPNAELDVKQTTCMAKAIYSEAEGEPHVGKAVVAYEIINRRKHKRYPDTFCGVVYQPAQYTDVRKREKTINYSSKAWRDSAGIAVYVQVGLINNPIGDATMHYNPKEIKRKVCKTAWYKKKYKGECLPAWNFDVIELVGNVYNHRFYREL